MDTDWVVSRKIRTAFSSSCSNRLRLGEDTSIMLHRLITVKWDTTVFPSGYLSVRDYLAASSSDFSPTARNQLEDDKLPGLENNFHVKLKTMTFYKWRDAYPRTKQLRFLLATIAHAVVFPFFYRLCLSISVRTRDERRTQGTDWEELGRKAGT